MNNTKRTIGKVGKVFLALLGGILFPILIWVALGVVISQKVRGTKISRAPAPTLGDILATAGYAGHKGASK